MTGKDAAIAVLKGEGVLLRTGNRVIYRSHRGRVLTWRCRNVATAVVTLAVFQELARRQTAREQEAV